MPDVRRLHINDFPRWYRTKMVSATKRITGHDWLMTNVALRRRPGFQPPEQDVSEHHALADAKHNMAVLCAFEEFEQCGR